MQVGRRPDIGIEQRDLAGFAGTIEHRGRALRPAHVCQHGIDGVNSRQRQPRRIAVQRGIVVGTDQALALRIDQDGGGVRHAAADSPHVVDAHAFRGKFGGDSFTERVVADAAPVRDVGAQACGRHSGIRRHAAAAFRECVANTLVGAVGIAGTW